MNYDQFISKPRSLRQEHGYLQDLHEILLKTLASAHIALFLLDKHSRVCSTTRAARQILGCSESAQGMGVNEILSDFGGFDFQLAVEEVTFCLKSKKICLQDSQNRWFDFTIDPYRAVGGHIDGAVVSMEEVTQRKVLAAKLELEQLINRNVIQVVPFPLLVISSSTEVKLVNLEFLKIVNSFEKDILNRELSSIAANAAIPKTLLEIINQALRPEAKLIEKQYVSLNNLHFQVKLRVLEASCSRERLVLLSMHT